MPRDFKGLTEVAGLSDARARLLVLGNWHKLNTVLRTRLAPDDVRRLLELEVAQGRSARANIVERLRSALCRAESRERKAASRIVMTELRHGRQAPAKMLELMGLDRAAARRVGKN